ncbi:MAG: hypothetical protein U9Q69_00180 [Nanoarchaeota archaeon]|nr:hypothetical protein [Nanoarchaeota archaeon]
MENEKKPKIIVRLEGRVSDGGINLRDGFLSELKRQLKEKLDERGIVKFGRELMEIVPEGTYQSSVNDNRENALIVKLTEGYTGDLAKLDKYEGTIKMTNKLARTRKPVVVQFEVNPYES